MKRLRKTKKIIIITLIAAGAFLTYSFSENYFRISKNLDIFATLYRDINLYYVDKEDPGKLIKTAIDAMLSSLDPYTVYYPESKIEDYKFMTTGEYGGIGATIRYKDGYVYIAEPYMGFPAYKAGLMAGDKLIKVNAIDVHDKTPDQVRDLLVGQSGTTVKVTIKRTGVKDLITKTVTREEVKIDAVPYYGMLGGGIGYIKLNSFTNSSAEEVHHAFKELEKQGVKKLVFDLRGNGGGLLEQAVSIVSTFVPKGTKVVYTKARMEEMNHVYNTSKSPINDSIPIVCLVDGGTASASEITSGALQDLDRAVVIGKRTFGKGIVQQVRSLSYNTKMKLTIAKYYIPSGRCVQKINYAKKDAEGHANKVPDSLIGKFYTLNSHRVVHDGRGIKPDITIEKQTASDILISLISKGLIFDYATTFHSEHDTIPPAKQFEFTDKDYKNFTTYLKDKKYDYTTQSEQLLKEFEEASKEDKYYDEVDNTLAQLKKEIQHNKEKDLYTFKDQIKQFTTQEIVSRYYYKKGRIIAQLKEDNYLSEAKKILNDSSMYYGILKGTYHQKADSLDTKN